jgi:hypothetical protein
MILIRLTYFSRNRIASEGGMVHDPIEAIFTQSTANNRRDEITGALVYDGKWFAQVLEGREATVSATFERILCDPRHSDVRLVKMHPVAARAFGAWSMARAAWSEDNADVFRHYGESERFDPQAMLPDRLGDLVEAVVNRTPQLQGRTSWTTRSATNAA